jgi:ABC-type molybdate transport system substrate-binding protein
MITWIGAACGVAVVLAAVGLSAGRGKAAEIKVYSGGAPKEVLIVLTPQFEKQTGHKVSFTYAVIAEIQKKLAAGEKPDMVLMPVPALDTLIKAGTLKAQPRPVLGNVGIGVIVREGAPRPDISTPESFKDALLKARSIVHAHPKATPSGAHLASVVESSASRASCKRNSPTAMRSMAASTSSPGVRWRSESIRSARSSRSRASRWWDRCRRRCRA